MKTPKEFAVTTTACRIAREAIKCAIRMNGERPSSYSSQDIRDAAWALAKSNRKLAEFAKLEMELLDELAPTISVTTSTKITG